MEYFGTLNLNHIVFEFGSIFLIYRIYIQITLKYFMCIGNNPVSNIKIFKGLLALFGFCFEFENSGKRKKQKRKKNRKGQRERSPATYLAGPAGWPSPPVACQSSSTPADRSSCVLDARASTQPPASHCPTCPIPLPSPG